MDSGQSGDMAKKLTELLKAQQFCLLTTFRKDETAVPTPMWFAFDDNTVVMMTKGQTAKVRRIKNNPKVTLCACNGNGRPLGPKIECQAKVLTTADEIVWGDKVLNARYGIKRKFLRLALKLSKDKTDAVIVVSKK